MNYNLNRLLNDLVKNSELQEQLRQDPQALARRYGQPVELMQSIADGDILTLFRQGAQPLLIMHLASILKFNVAERYKELLAKEQSAKETARESAGMAYYKDLREYIGALEEANLLQRVKAPIHKDTEMHPLVRWQFRGLEERDRKAFLFEHPVDGKGTQYSGSVLIAGLAASTAVYAKGMQCAPEDIHAKWQKGLHSPIEPVLVEEGPVQEVVMEGEDIRRIGFGTFPIPISTPGFDNAPYSTAGHWVTKDPETGIRNVGNYRGQLKAPDRMGVYCVGTEQNLIGHWYKCKEMGKPLEAALVIGTVPAVSFAAVSRVPYGVDEFAVAGGIAGEPIPLVRCKTVDLEVPATAEIVIEGIIPTDTLEYEAPFGEAHGYMSMRVLSPYFQVTRIMHRKHPIWVSFISQVTPSESSKIKQIGRQSVLYHFLKHERGIEEVLNVSLIELGNASRWCVLQMKRGSKEKVWEALQAVSESPIQPKVAIAVDEDIDPWNTEAVVWLLCSSLQPHRDTKIVPVRATVHDYSHVSADDRLGEAPILAKVENTHEATALLIDGTRKVHYPPTSLPAKPYMDHAMRIWNELGLPELHPQNPWFGYELGHWSDEDKEEAQLAVEGRYYETGDKIAARRVPVKEIEKRYKQLNH